jgi:hypothetical protein
VTLAAYTAGISCVAAYLAGMLFVASRLRSTTMPRLGGAQARLADALLAIAVMVLATELLGSLGWLGRWQLLLTASFAALGAHLATTRARRTRRPGPAPTGATPMGGAIAAAMILAGVAGQWVAWSAVGLHSGPTSIDTLRYHLPLVARFIQGHRMTHLQFLDQDLLPTYDPLNAEMLHVDAGVLFGNDMLSAIVNLGWLAVALLSAGAIHQQLGKLRVQVTLAVAASVSVPVLVVTNAGAATDDLAVVALVLASAAFLVCALQANRPAEAGSSRESEAADPPTVGSSPIPLVAMSGLAAGLAAGTKFDALAPAAVIGVIVACAWRRSRWRALGSWSASALAAGGFWYLRNWVDAGNPSPETPVHLGPLRLPAVNDPVARLTGYSVAHYATDLGFWRHTVLPGLSQAFGPAWWVVLAATFAGSAFAVARGPASARILAATSALPAVAYLFTPYSAGGPEGDPWLFTPDLRFLLPSIALGLLASAIAAGSSRLFRRLWTGTLTVALVYAWLARSGPYAGWPAGNYSSGIVAALVVMTAATVVHVAKGVTWQRRSLAGSHSAVTYLGVSALALSLVASGFFVARGYPARRFASIPLARWAATLHGQRIGELGYPLAYPLYGYDFSNHVVYLEEPDGSGSLVPDTTCRRFADALADARVRWVVIGSNTINPPGTPEIGWTETVTTAKVVLRRSGATVLELKGPVQPARCVDARPPGSERT